MITINNYLEIGINEGVLQVNSGVAYSEVELTEKERYTTIGNLSKFLMNELTKEIRENDDSFDNLQIELYQKMLAKIAVEYCLKGEGLYSID